MRQFIYNPVNKSFSIKTKIFTKLTDRQLDQLSSQAKYCADNICLTYAWIDFYESLLKGASDEEIVDLMFKISGSVSQYNVKIPSAITKYGTSTTNMTASDWIIGIVYDLNPNVSIDKSIELENEYRNKIVIDKKSDYAYLGTSFSKSALVRILNIYRTNVNKNKLKDLISQSKKSIQKDKLKFSEFKKDLIENK